MEFGLVVAWLGFMLVLGLIARPIAAWLLPGLDHDALAFPLALAVIGVVGHLIGHIAFGWPAAIAGIGTLVASSYWALDRAPLDHRRFTEAALVFTAAFLLVIWIRALAPAAAPLPVAVGEKMLDFGLLQSLLRAPRLPPEDMWFAGKPVRYHYGGHMLTAILATTTGTAGRYAYNLALAGFYATLIVTAYGLAGSIATDSAASRRAAGALGAFFVGLAGNLDTPGRVVIWLLPAGPDRVLASGLGYDTAVLDWQPRAFSYFDASRVLPVDPTDPDSFMAATEFPLFAWLNGDLHAHMMSQPLLLLAAAVVLAYWRTPDTPTHRTLLLFGALPPLAGFIAVVNIWSFPTVIALVALGVAFAPGDPAPLRHALPTLTRRAPPIPTGPDWGITEARRLALAIAASLLVALLAILWTAPYWGFVVLGGPALGVGPWDRWTPLGGFLRVHGAFILVIGLYLVAATAPTSDTPHTYWAAGLVILAAAIFAGMPAIGFALPLGLGAWWLLRHDPDPGYEWLLVLAGAGLIALIEFVTVESERFNTVFKYSAHVWLFWAIATGVALARLNTGWPATATTVDLPRWHTIGRTVTAITIITTAVYAGFALPTHATNPGPPVATTGPTLDALGYVDVRFPTEAPAIHWLGDQPRRPVIVTAAPAGYWWRPDRGEGSAAPASLTGLPTVLGWFHEYQYRGPTAYQRRLDHVRTIYEGPPTRQRTLLARYNVRYVYVGPAERATYDDITIGDLKAVAVAEHWTGVTIYRIDQSAL